MHVQYNLKLNPFVVLLRPQCQVCRWAKVVLCMPLHCDVIAESTIIYNTWL